MTIDKNAIIAANIERLEAAHAAGDITADELENGVEFENARRGYPYFISLINSYDYWNIYGIATAAGSVVGTVAVGVAGRVAGKRVFETWATGYTKTALRRIFKEYA